jgi:hypothetical protein
LETLGFVRILGSTDLLLPGGAFLPVEVVAVVLLLLLASWVGFDWLKWR